MTITVTPDDTYQPPRVEIEVSVEAGGSMETVAVYRTVAGVRKLIREQPAVGLDSRIVYDYETPREVPVTYEWESDYVSPTALSQVLAEAWSNTSAWTVTNGSDGTWAASGGKLVRQNGPDRDAVVSKSFTPNRYRVTFAAAPVGISVIDFGGFQINLEARRLIAGAASAAFVPGAGAWVIDVTLQGVTLTTDSGVFTVSAAGVEMSKIEFRGALAALAPAGELDAWTPPWTRRGVVVASSRVFVLCYDSSGNYQDARISVFSTTGAHLTDIDFTVGSGNGQINEAVGITYDGTYIVVAEKGNSRVQRFTIGGSGASTTLTYFDKWGSAGSGDGQFNGLRGVAADGSGNIYTIELEAYRVQKFTSAGAFSTKWGSYGSGNSQFYDPTAIAVIGSSVYVADFGSTTNNTLPRIRKFSTTGTFQALVALDSYSAPVFGMAGITGILIASDMSGRIQTYSATLEASVALLPPAAFPASEVRLATSGTTLYVAGRFPTPDTFYTITTASVDDVTVDAYGGTLRLSESASPVTLEPTDAWMIHPSRPVLSIPLHRDDIAASGFDIVGDLNSRSNTVTHELLGQKYPVAINTGPRTAPAFQLVISTETRAEFQAVQAIIADDVPLLVLVPPSWELDFPDGFLSLGDAVESRALQMYGQPARRFTFPAQVVEAPDVDVEEVGWSWAALASEFPTWDSLLAAFASWADVLTNTRRPGF